MLSDALFDAPPVFDLEAFGDRQAQAARLRQAQAERDARLADVDDHADLSWKETAEGIVIALAQTGKHFTSDDVMDALARAQVTTHDTRALGPIFRKAVHREWIHRVGYVPSRRRHATAIAQYIGMI